MHPGFYDVSNVPFLLTGTEVEIVTEGFGIVMKRDSFAALLCIQIH